MSKSQRVELMAGKREKISEQIVMQMNYSLIQWLGATAKEAGISRNALIRTFLEEKKREVEAVERDAP